MVRKHEICTMQILLIAATEHEIKPVNAEISGLDLLITGIGVPSTMYHLQKRIHQKKYELIIQAGIAGCFNADFALGKTVLVKKDCFADLGIEEKENYTPIFKTPLATEDEFPFEKGWLVNRTVFKNNAALPFVNAKTVNKVRESGMQKQQFINSFNADIESMEGAALHYV